MSQRGRQTLRSFFAAGQLPTADHFGDLIDSTLNMSDEGFRKSALRGFEVSTAVGHDALISFLRDQSAHRVLWSIGYGGAQDQLHFRSGDAEPAEAPLLALDAAARVGINTAAPRQALEVAGVVASRGRLGTWQPDNADASPGCPADGEWHDLTDHLSGCQAFEVMAGVGQRHGGRYALLHAVALNTFNPDAGWLDFLSRKKRIRSQAAWYGKRCDRLELRWNGSGGHNASYRLQIRSRCDYGEGIMIRAHLTQLWFDPTMQEGQSP